MCLAASLVLGVSVRGLAAPALVVHSSASAGSLALDGTGSASLHIVKVADLSLSTSAASGLTVWITSGALSKDGGTPVAFQVALVDHNAAPPSGSTFTTASGVPYLFATTAATAVAKDLYIQYRPGSLQDPGAYVASIDIDVVDN
jgi:hypothetical protein